MSMTAHLNHAAGLGTSDTASDADATYLKGI